MDIARLRRALEMVTEGESAAVPKAFLPEAVATFREARPWQRSKGIQGFGISEKTTEGKISGPLVLKGYVDKKLPKSKLRYPVPGQIPLPSLGEPLTTDVEEIGQVQAEAFTGRLRPAVPGCGLGHIHVTVGTFGCLVRKIGSKSPLYILSNSHVLARTGFGRKGDQIIQPGRRDGGSPGPDKIGELAEFVPFDLSRVGYPNLVDAAIARTRARLVRPEVRLLGPITGVSSIVRRGMRVQKVGRTTDHTVGVVRDVDFRTRVGYRKPNRQKFTVGFRNQVLCSRYTAGGDSGSAVLNTDRKIIGLHFAGSDSTSIFTRITTVFASFGVELVTG